jgi:hypothetical protein
MATNKLVLPKSVMREMLGKQESESSLAFGEDEISNLSSQNIEESIKRVSIPKLQAKINKSEYQFAEPNC